MLTTKKRASHKQNPKGPRSLYRDHSACQKLQNTIPSGRNRIELDLAGTPAELFKGTQVVVEIMGLRLPMG
jgi:hypothetical protein